MVLDLHICCFQDVVADKAENISEVRTLLLRKDLCKLENDVIHCSVLLDPLNELGFVRSHPLSFKSFLFSLLVLSVNLLEKLLEDFSRFDLLFSLLNSLLAFVNLQVKLLKLLFLVSLGALYFPELLFDTFNMLIFIFG